MEPEETTPISEPPTLLGQRIPYDECESPVEDIFLEEFRKVANDEIRVWRQHECQTSAGTFRLDFALGHIARGPEIGIECDGRDFHSADRDRKRDAAIVAVGIVNKIYRLRGRDLFFRVFHTLDLLATVEPGLFSQRGLVNLETLCSPRSRCEDFTGPGMRKFAHGVFRYFGFPADEEEDEEFRPLQPVIINWTQRDAQQNA